MSKARIAATAPPEIKEPPRAQGLVVKEVWRFEVVDIWALANRHDLVRIEANTSTINAAISGGMRECPGLRIWSETKAGVRV